jgi:tetratricopeptide (TPR) repeat protein
MNRQVGADRIFDLRVDDHPQPIVELRRLVRLQRAYARANRGDELMSEKKVDAALIEYREASKLAPEILELPFWHAVTLASIDREAEAAPIFKQVFAKEPIWADLLERLPAAGLFPNDPALIARLRKIRRSRDDVSSRSPQPPRRAPRDRCSRAAKAGSTSA